MKKIFFTAAIVLACVLNLNAKDEETPTKKVEVETFDRIFLEGSYDVFFEQTDGKPYVVIKARQKVLDQIYPVITDGKLTLAKTGNNLFSNSGVDIWCYGKSLKEVIISGTSNMHCKNGFETEKLYLEMNGAGSLDLYKVEADEVEMHVNGAGSGDLYEIDCDKLKVIVAGAGGSEITGEATTADVELDGVGGIDITKLKVENLSSRVAGIGKISR